MDNASYATLTRQSGLMQEMQIIANNIANAATTGFRAEGVLFSEHIAALGPDAPSLSMAAARVPHTLTVQGGLAQTGGPFDLAIEGEGFFLIETPDGERLTRAGAFSTNETGDLVTIQGHPVLDGGGAPVFIPQGVGPVGISADGTISADGVPVGQIGLFMPVSPGDMRREGGVMFDPIGGYEPAPDARVLQGFLEESNVNPVLEISRMIAVQRAYELGQSFLEKEDARIRGVIEAMR
jgi:flagellar basal-body rod protein FlgF